MRKKACIESIVIGAAHAADGRGRCLLSAGLDGRGRGDGETRGLFDGGANAGAGAEQTQRRDQGCRVALFEGNFNSSLCGAEANDSGPIAQACYCFSECLDGYTLHRTKI